MTSYSEWLSTQPEKVQNDILGTDKANQFRNGSYKPEKFEGTKPLTLDEFKSKRSIITSREDKTNGSEA